MSDNFTIFREVIEDCTEAELDWLAETERQLYDTSDWPDWARATISEDPEALLFPMIQIDRPRRRVVIYSDDNASPLAVVPLVQGFLRRFRPCEAFSRTWAAGNTEPGPGELGGGAMFITANAVRQLDVWTWVDEHRRELVTGVAA
jgi:hypothetical protein